MSDSSENKQPDLDAGGEFGDIDFNAATNGHHKTIIKLSPATIEGGGDIPPHHPAPIIQEINDNTDGTVQQTSTTAAHVALSDENVHGVIYSDKRAEEVLKISEHDFNRHNNLPPKDDEISVDDLIAQEEDNVDAGTIKSESVKYYSSKVEEGAVGGVGARVEQELFEYRMSHKHRGCFVIFNHMLFDEHLKMTTRKGTQVDAKNLENTARHLGFEFVRTFNDLTVKEIRKWIKAISSSDHSDYDCFVCCVLTHGDENDILYARDDILSFDEFTIPFRGDKCPTLAGKPKLFFIQACRGTNLDDGYDYVDAGLMPVTNTIKEQEPVVRVPVEADFLFAFSTVPGYYAWRNQTAGSWFVQAVCNCLQTYGQYMEIMKVMTRVNRMVAYEFESSCKSMKEMHRKKQIPHIVTRLTAEIYFREKKNKHADTEQNK